MTTGAGVLIAGVLIAGATPRAAALRGLLDGELHSADAALVVRHLRAEPVDLPSAGNLAGGDRPQGTRP